MLRITLLSTGEFLAPYLSSFSLRATHCRGWQHLVAYGSQDLVVVVDPRTVQCLQTLSYHKANVIKVAYALVHPCSEFLRDIPLQVRWASDRYHHSMMEPYRLRLASVDSSSDCAIWDVTEGTVTTNFSLGSRPLVDIQWLEANVR